MVDPGDLPVADPAEVKALLRDLPLALDEAFTRFVLGFPRRYLARTPRAEIIKHYGLMASLGGKAVISSLAREGELWKLSLIARDRRFLFCRIAGALSGHGMNIVAAEAFANTGALVLDTFRFADDERRFDDDAERRSFQGFLEDAVEGKADLEPRLRERLARLTPAPGKTLSVEFDDTPGASTRLLVEASDRFGLLYFVTRCISEAGCDIERAFVETPGRRVHDEFHLTRDGRPLPAEARADLRRRLVELGDRYFRQDPPSIG